MSHDPLEPYPPSLALDPPKDFSSRPANHRHASRMRTAQPAKSPSFDTSRFQEAEHACAERRGFHVFPDDDCYTPLMDHIQSDEVEAALRQMWEDQGRPVGVVV